MKVENYSKLEEEIVDLRMHLDEMTQIISAYQVLEGSSIKLGEIIKKSIKFFNHVWLGFRKGTIIKYNKG